MSKNPSATTHRTPYFSPKLLAALIIGALALPVQAAGTFTVLGFLGAGETSRTSDVSSDGSVVVGASGGEAFRWANGTIIGLGFLSDGANSIAYGVSGDGSVVVGDSGSEAFRWASGTMIGLGFLSGGAKSRALATSSDGAVVVGMSINSRGRPEAFRWTTVAGSNGGGTMTGLGFLPSGADSGASGISSQEMVRRRVHREGSFSSASGVSSDGTVVVGLSINSSGQSEAFRWTTAAESNGSGTMIGLGFLPGQSYSNASDISSDGTVVVGWSTKGVRQSEAFRWTTAAGPNGGGTMTGLGFLPGGSFSLAQGVSGDGSVVVGYSTNGGEEGAFRWTQSTGMVSVASWLAGAGVAVPTNWSLDNATGVNSDGSVIVGVGKGNTQAWLARVGPDGNGLLTEVATFNNTLAEAGGRGIQSSAGLPNLTLFGAHHRSLLDNGLARTDNNGSCAWGTADAARYDKTDTRMELAEVGVCKDIGNARFGVGVGQAWARQRLSLGGSVRHDGQYLLIEVGQAYANGLQPSITGYYGRFNSRMQRNYMNGATLDSSTANPDNRSLAVRLRLDWKDAAQFAGFSLTPYTAYSFAETKLDAYTETGGGFPAQFAASTWRTNDLRVGTAARMAISGATDLRLGLEAAYRFENNTSGVNGQAVGLWSFSLPGQKVTQTWCRATVDIDHRLSSSLALTLGANAASSGGDANWGVTAGVLVSF